MKSGEQATCQCGTEGACPTAKPRGQALRHVVLLACYTLQAGRERASGTLWSGSGGSRSGTAARGSRLPPSRAPLASCGASLRRATLVLLPQRRCMWGTDRRMFCASFHAQALRRFPAAARSWWRGHPAGEATPWQQWWDADVPVRWLALAVLLGSFLLAVLRNLARSGWPEALDDAGLLGVPRAAACALRSAAGAAASQLAAEATASLYDAWQTLLMFVAKTAVLALVYDWLWLAARRSCRVSNWAVGHHLGQNLAP